MTRDEFDALTYLVRQWAYCGKSSQANDEDWIRDACALELEDVLSQFPIDDEDAS